MRLTDTAVILTGASRGLGAALARALLDNGAWLITLARSSDADFDEYARARDLAFIQTQADLSDPSEAARAAESACAALPAQAPRYWLINNAGALAPVARADALGEAGADALAMAAAFNLNVVAPMLLTARFLNTTRHLGANVSSQRRVLNISSGAGRNPRAGWSVYCASKAALDMATRVAALEQSAQEQSDAAPAQLVSLAPGIVNTAMQAHIRASDPAHFPTRAQFQAFYDDGQLSAPADTARRIIDFLASDRFGDTPLADIRDIAPSPTTP